MENYIFVYVCACLLHLWKRRKEDKVDEKKCKQNQPMIVCALPVGFCSLKVQKSVYACNRKSSKAFFLKSQGCFLTTE